MDTEGVEARGVDPLAPLLAEIDAIGTVEDLLDYFGASLRRGTGAPIGLGVDADPGEPVALRPLPRPVRHPAA